MTGKLDEGIESCARAATPGDAEVHYHRRALARWSARCGARDGAQAKSERGNGYESISAEVDRLLAELQ